ncbi:hypothetical protein [Flavobacterium frigoris]|uniref:Uncharacterized protein n=1 Tax=Flavobacterium frigoris (strain PS1) TaxID=1086011 RepID=H7FM80_FLAFP|nr:hypothetical protein [Flavobacterium frigoris]EIA10418.1 hypothetical protein HJ01_00278 [Flavobacterium frigoris PS1]
MEVSRIPKNKLEALIEKLQPYQTDKGLVRLGPNGDGGYLVPNDLEGIVACFSPGVDLTSGFEENSCKLGMEIYLASVSVIKPNLNLPDDIYNFLSKYIGCTNNKDFLTIDEWVKCVKIEEHFDLLLQMDIQGQSIVQF